MKFKPLHDLILIERFNQVEIKEKNGLVIVSGDEILKNFDDYEDAMADVQFKKQFGKKDLEQKLIEVANKKHGLVHSIDTERPIKDEWLHDIITQKKEHCGKVVSIGKSVKYYRRQDFLFYRGQSEVLQFQQEGKDYILVSEKQVLCKRMGEKLVPHPDFVLVKITRQSREDLFKKKFIKDDGTEGFIFITVDEKEGHDRKCELFVQTGEIVGVGKNVVNVRPKDVAIIHYGCDNNPDLIVGYDKGDKIIAVDAVTTRHTEDNIIYANRKGKRTQMAWAKDDYDNLSSLIGVVRNSELISLDPFVFLQHEENVVGKVTRSGIVYVENQQVYERKVLSASQRTNEHYGTKRDDIVLVHDMDVFSVMVDGKKISCINDIDILAVKGETGLY